MTICCISAPTEHTSHRHVRGKEGHAKMYGASVGMYHTAHRYMCRMEGTVKVEILGSVIFSVNGTPFGKNNFSVLRTLDY